MLWIFIYFDREIQSFYGKNFFFAEISQLVYLDAGADTGQCRLSIQQLYSRDPVYQNHINDFRVSRQKVYDKFRTGTRKIYNIF